MRTVRKGGLNFTGTSKGLEIKKSTKFWEFNSEWSRPMTVEKLPARYGAYPWRGGPEPGCLERFLRGRERGKKIKEGGSGSSEGKWRPRIGRLATLQKKPCLSV